MDKSALVLFSHGKESGPWGSKIMALAETAMALDAHVISIDYSDLTSPEERVNRLLARDLPNHDTLILVGSSMGGYVSTVASEILRPAGLFLLAPAFYVAGYQNQEPISGAQHTLVVHGNKDEIIPIANSKVFCERNGVQLVEVESDHRLNDVIPNLQKMFETWLAEEVLAVR